MSAAKRRIKRKIAMLVRMDATHYWCQRRYNKSSYPFVTPRARRIEANMRALGHALGRQGHKDKALKELNVGRHSRGYPSVDGPN